MWGHSESEGSSPSTSSAPRARSTCYPSVVASTRSISAWSPARAEPLNFPKHLCFEKHAFFPVERCFLVKFPTGCNQELRLFPSRGCFLQQSSTGCSTVTRTSLTQRTSGDCFPSPRARPGRIRLFILLMPCSLHMRPHPSTAGTSVATILLQFLHHFSSSAFLTSSRTRGTQELLAASALLPPAQTLSRPE